MRRSIFLFFLVLYLATTAGHIYTIDSYLNYAATKSIGSYHKISMPRSMMTVEGRGGLHYSKLGIGQGLANLPMYYLGGLAELLWPGHKAFKAYSEYVYIPARENGETRLIRSEPQTLIRISEIDGSWVFFTTLTNAFVVAGACLLFFLVLASFGLTARWSFLGALMLGFATPFWVYSRDLFGDPLLALGLLGTFLLLAGPGSELTPRRAAVAGLLTSAGIVTRLSFAPLAAVFAVYVVLAAEDRRRALDLALWYALFAGPGVVAAGALNWVRFQSVFMSGYHTAFDKGFSLPLAKGLFYNLASPYRSIFLYAPPVLLFFFGAAHFARRHRAELLLIAAITVYMFGLYSRWWAWHGGWCWGPRFYLPLIPLLMLPGLVRAGRLGAADKGGAGTGDGHVPGDGAAGSADLPDPGRRARRRRMPAVVVGLGAAGFVVQVGAVLINYTAAYDYWIKVGRLDWGEAGIYMFSPVTTHWRAVFSTPPAQYDLWVIQCVREAGPAFAIVGAALAALALFIGAAVKKRLGAGPPSP